MWSTYEVIRQSAPLTVVVEAFEEEGEFELLSVKGQRKPPGESCLSDVGWFNHHYDCGGAEVVLFGDDGPVDVGKHWFRGRMIADRSWTDCGWEYDDRFEVEEYRLLGF